MSASASLSTRLRPGLFNFCRRSFGWKCSRTRENRMGPARCTGPDPPIPTSYWSDFWNSSATWAPPRAASASASFFAASRCACVLSCWVRPSRARSLRPVMLPTTSLALPLTSSIPLSGVRGLSDSRPLPIHQAAGQVIRRGAVLLLKTVNPAPRRCGFPCRHTLKHLMPPRGYSCR
jgi:hypothetical protein